MYRLGSIREVEVKSDDGTEMTGRYKIKELNWNKERKANGSYELSFSIRLQKQ